MEIAVFVLELRGHKQTDTHTKTSSIEHSYIESTNLAISRRLGVDIDSRQIVFLRLIWLHGDHVKEFLSWSITKRVHGGRVAWALTCKQVNFKTPDNFTLFIKDLTWIPFTLCWS